MFASVQAKHLFDNTYDLKTRVHSKKKKKVHHKSNKREKNLAYRGVGSRFKVQK